MNENLKFILEWISLNSCLVIVSLIIIFAGLESVISIIVQGRKSKEVDEDLDK